jgi:hypothetical protein
VRSDEKAHLSSCPEPCRVALAVYRSGNGWLAYYPAHGTPCPAATTWGGCISHMKSIAAAIPQLEAHAAFGPAGPGNAPDLPIVVPEKIRDCAISGHATVLGTAPVAASTSVWPAPPAGCVEASAVEASVTPIRLRLDVGWALWDAEAEGSNIQYQVPPLLLTLAGLNNNPDSLIACWVGTTSVAPNALHPQSGERS